MPSHEPEPMHAEIARLRDQVAALRDEVTWLNRTLRQKNLALDALHYVWCNGGCPEGTHRWVPGEITEELVVAAERQTSRLRTWWTNHQGRLAKKGGHDAYPNL